MGAIVIRTRYDEGTESAEVATSDVHIHGVYMKIGSVKHGGYPVRGTSARGLNVIK